MVWALSSIPGTEPIATWISKPQRLANWNLAFPTQFQLNLLTKSKARYDKGSYHTGNMLNTNKSTISA
jgi:hypothetical protein